MSPYRYGLRRKLLIKKFVWLSKKIRWAKYMTTSYIVISNERQMIGSTLFSAQLKKCNLKIENQIRREKLCGKYGKTLYKTRSS